MLTCSSIVKHFGEDLYSTHFQAFLAEHFSDLTEYDILDTDYISSEIKGIELGFTNTTAITDEATQTVFEKGIPIFTHFNLFPVSANFITSLPYNCNFDNLRNEIHQIAGLPLKTKEGYIEILQKQFLVDNYQIDGFVISFDFDPESNKITSIQFRSSNLLEIEP
jgi:hypothetical protein